MSVTLCNSTTQITSSSGCVGCYSHNTSTYVNENLDFYDKYFKFITTPNTFGNGDSIINGFYISDSPSISWEKFIKYIIIGININCKEQDNTLIENKKKELSLWKRCTLCKKLFPKMVSLVDENLNISIFKNLNKSNIPIELYHAISQCRKMVKTIKNELCFNTVTIGQQNYNFSIYYGEENYGCFEHISISPKIHFSNTKAININKILSKFTLQLMNNFEIWFNHINALICIDNAYD